MGYNTVVFILNDHLSAIEADPERFVRDISNGLRGDSPYVLGQTTVMPTKHADDFRLYATRQNGICELSEWSKHTVERLRGSPIGRQVIKEHIACAEANLAGLKKLIAKIEAEEQANADL